MFVSVETRALAKALSLYGRHHVLPPQHHPVQRIHQIRSRRDAIAANPPSSLIRPGTRRQTMAIQVSAAALPAIGSTAIPPVIPRLIRERLKTVAIQVNLAAFESIDSATDPPARPRPIRERRKTVAIQTTSADLPNEVWCVCRGPEFGRMIFCENSKCLTQWFHFDCMRIKNVSKDDWYCPNCRIIMNKQ